MYKRGEKEEIEGGGERGEGGREGEGRGGGRGKGGSRMSEGGRGGRRNIMDSHSHGAS